MPTFSTSDIITSPFKAIGFDLDNTLYDEYDFISQVYYKLSQIIAKEAHLEQDIVYNTLCCVWLQHDSKYPHLFQEAFTQLKITLNDSLKKELIQQYRNFSPDLKLSKRISFLLDQLSRQSKILFLVTDGHILLQKNKIEALGLTRWFNGNAIWISEMGYTKPSIEIASQISSIQTISPQDILFIGDHQVDEEFAKNCGFHFLKVFS